MAALKENTKAIFNYVRDNAGTDFTYTDIADALGIPAKSVTGSLTSLQKKGLIVREDAVVETADGTTAKVKFIRVTDLGKSFDPGAETE